MNMNMDLDIDKDTDMYSDTNKDVDMEQGMDTDIDIVRTNKRHGLGKDLCHSNKICASFPPLKLLSIGTSREHYGFTYTTKPVSGR